MLRGVEAHMTGPPLEWRHDAERLVAEGERHARLGENSEALTCYVEALDLVPEPRGDHEVTARIFGGLRQVLEARGDLGDGLELLLASRPGVGAMLATVAGTGEWKE
jgi:hypothetical protein